jgi:hypothetical protein
MQPRLRFLALWLCLACLIWPITTQPARADCVLSHAGFEGGFTSRTGDEHVIVANGWEYWYQDGPHQQDGHNWRPTYREATIWDLGGRRVRSGRSAQKFGTQHATHNAGVYQRVAVPRGSHVTLTVWAQAWSSSDGDTSTVSEPGNYRLYVGIDPTGGTNWAGPSVRWSEPRMEYNTWVQLSISAQAEADAVTVFLRGHPEFRVRHNESFWDDACLTVVRPTPRPTDTPKQALAPDRPTSTPTITPTPTVTATPTETPTPTPSPTPVLLDLCVHSFEDLNADGVRDEGEKLIAGAAVTLLDSEQARVGAGQTTGDEQPRCFALPAGIYTLVMRSPAGYEATGDAGQTLTLVDAPVSVLFGYRPLPVSTPQPVDAAPTKQALAPDKQALAPGATPAPSPTAEGSRPLAALGRALYGVSGILVALVAVGLLALPRYLRMGR